MTKSLERCLNPCRSFSTNIRTMSGGSRITRLRFQLETQNLFLFLNGDIFILVIIDLGEMAKLADKRRLRLTLLNDPDMAFQIEGERDYLEGPFVLKISQHLFTRIALECLSLD